MISLQDMYAPNNRCFGCGPANDKGLRIKSFVKDDKLVAQWEPQPHHQAFDQMLNGGICGALLDCHSNWAAAFHLMKRREEKIPPCTVTAEYYVKLLHPTPMQSSLILSAHIVELSDRKAVVEATITAEDRVTASCRGVFVAVKEGHPAFHRW